LLLRDTAVREAKKPLVRAYIAQILPKARVAAETVLASDRAPLEAREAVLR